MTEPAPTSRPPPPPRPYQAFWDSVGARFTSFKGAASTAYYLDCERMLFEELAPSLHGKVLLKTDLWNEAKNTEILVWAEAQGAFPVGIDIAFDTVKQGLLALDATRSRAIVSDVRSLAFPDDTFDVIYSMGTIEHFRDYDVAVREMFRVLKPGGRAIVGVPNKLDPFLRPALVAALNAFGLYAYGLEKSFTMGGLRRVLEAEGFRVSGESGVLFMPGWLRMLDLLCHTRFPVGEPLTALLVRPFAWLYRRAPRLRRHGYLIACLGEKD